MGEYASTSCAAKQVAMTARVAAGHRLRTASGSVCPSTSTTAKKPPSCLGRSPNWAPSISSPGTNAAAVTAAASAPSRAAGVTAAHRFRRRPSFGMAGA